LRAAAAKSGNSQLLEEIRAVLDPQALPDRWDLAAPASNAWEPRPLVALVGHRSAGKSRLLPLLSRWTGLPGWDLDEVIAERAGQSVASLFTRSPSAFREAERAAFASLTGSVRGPALVATGGGFLSLHADLLRGHTAVLVPITFETYRTRLLADRTRPRLRPELTIEEELTQVYAEREREHAATLTVSLFDFLRHTASGTWQRPA
jgi:shikimate kinase